MKSIKIMCKQHGDTGIQSQTVEIGKYHIDIIIQQCELCQDRSYNKGWIQGFSTAREKISEILQNKK